MATMRQQFEDYKKEFNKTYKTLQKEQRRFEIFEATVKEINKHNEDYDKGLIRFTKSINEFADGEAKELHIRGIPWSKFHFKK